MKTLLEKTTRDEVIARIASLTEGSKAEWGKMNVYQMIRHCTLFEEMVLGEKKYSHSFIGRFFGKMALKNILKDEKPLGRNTPTLTEFKIKETHGDIALEKPKWISLIGSYEHFSKTDFTHPFFGKMTLEQVGRFAYKHADHHLRQFGA